MRNRDPLNRICLVLDNSAAHKAKSVRELTQKLNIVLIYLPPYSPDLNPIEILWKSIEKIISIAETENKDELMDVVRSAFFGLTANLSIARMWIPRFLYDNLNLLC